MHLPINSPERLIGAAAMPADGANGRGSARSVSRKGQDPEPAARSRPRHARPCPVPGDWQEEVQMRTHTIRALCAVTAGAAILAFGSAGPAGAAASPACRTHPVIAYVVNPASGTVTPIRTATNTALTAIKVGIAPLAIAITPNGKTAYVASALLNAVTPISTATDTAGKPIGVGDYPWDIAITPNGRTAYVANSGSGTVTPISTATNTAGKPIRVGDSASAIAITPNGRTAYVVDEGSVTPISTATNTAGKPIKIPFSSSISPAGVPGQTLIVSTPNGKTVYVA